MNIEKYYWEAKDENEARVINALLKTNYANDWETNKVGHLRIWWVENNIGINAHQSRKDWVEGRTLSTIPALVEMVLRGLKDAWEVAPEGKKLATMEQRKKFDYPTDCEVSFCHRECSDWPVCVDNSNPWINPNYAFAVPTSYEFETSKQKQIRETAEQIRTLATKLEELKKGD